jgi:hypothetical protein
MTAAGSVDIVLRRTVFVAPAPRRLFSSVPSQRKITGQRPALHNLAYLVGYLEASRRCSGGGTSTEPPLLKNAVIIRTLSAGPREPAALGESSSGSCLRCPLAPVLFSPGARSRCNVRDLRVGGMLCVGSEYVGTGNGMPGYVLLAFSAEQLERRCSSVEQQSLARNSRLHLRILALRPAVAISAQVPLSCCRRKALLVSGVESTSCPFPCRAVSRVIEAGSHGRGQSQRPHRSRKTLRPRLRPVAFRRSRRG